jgi:hypothetical protein
MRTPSHVATHHGYRNPNDRGGRRMGRRRNNPELVQELIDRRWDDTMSEQEYTEKYLSLSSSDMSTVAAAIDGMEAEFFAGDDDQDEGSDY